jgi:hypothetical protein
MLLRASATRLVQLATPPPACVVPASVFDSFGWCPSDELEWRRPEGRWDDATPIDGGDPARMVFVMRAPWEPLPRELARLHATGMGLGDEEALAPWAIDDATDALYARRVRPKDVFWLAADNLNALFWGLHDWVHFHNHGSFEQRAWTELQCDATALSWLWANRERVPLAVERWESVRKEAEALSRARFVSEGQPFDARLFEADRLRDLLQRGPLTAPQQSLCSKDLEQRGRSASTETTDSLLRTVARRPTTKTRAQHDCER